MKILFLRRLLTLVLSFITAMVSSNVVAQSSDDDGLKKPGSWTEFTSYLADGGDLGWFTADQFGPDFGQRLTALKDGEVSEPFRTEAGWHIVQREGPRQTDVTDQNRRAQVRDTIGRRKLEEEYNRYLLELRGEAYVSFRTGDPAIDNATPDTAMSAPGAAEEAARAGKKQRGEVKALRGKVDPGN